MLGMKFGDFSVPSSTVPAVQLPFADTTTDDKPFSDYPMTTTTAGLPPVLSPYHPLDDDITGEIYRHVNTPPRRSRSYRINDRN